MNSNRNLNVFDQIELLKSKKIIIDNDSKEILNNINYYNLMSFKNIFYENGKVHNYKKNIRLKDFYVLYNIDNQIKRVMLTNFQHIKSILINRIVGFFDSDFTEEKYLDKNLYKTDFIKKIYIQIIKDNYVCNNYYKEHGFLPIWIILNSLNYIQFIDYVVSFNNDIYNNLFVDMHIKDLIFSKKYFTKILTGEKIYDYSADNLNINTILNLLSIFKINIDEIVNLYKKIYTNIPSVNKDDVLRETGMLEVYLHE